MNTTANVAAPAMAEKQAIKIEVVDYARDHGGVRVMIEGKECSICSVVGYALYCKDDPVAAVLRTAERMLSHPYDGHKMVWISRSATVMTSSRAHNERAAAERAMMLQLELHDCIQFEGVKYVIAPDHNDNFRLVKA